MKLAAPVQSATSRELWSQPAHFGLVPERPLGWATPWKYKRAVPAWGASLGQKARLIRPEVQSVTVPTMGDFWLCLLLLLSTQALAREYPLPGPPPTLPALPLGARASSTDVGCHPS